MNKLIEKALEIAKIEEGLRKEGYDLINVNYYANGVEVTILLHTESFFELTAGKPVAMTTFDSPMGEAVIYEYTLEVDDYFVKLTANESKEEYESRNGNLS